MTIMKDLSATVDPSAICSGIADGAALLELARGWLKQGNPAVADELLGSAIRSAEADGEGEAPDVSRTIGRVVFWVVMLIVGVAFFEALKLTLVTEPLQAFLNQVFEYAPRFIAAGFVLLVAWLLARAARFIVAKALTVAKLDRRLTREAGVEGDADVPLTKTISEAIYWLVFLIFLPAVLDDGPRLGGNGAHAGSRPGHRAADEGHAGGHRHAALAAVRVDGADGEGGEERVGLAHRGLRDGRLRSGGR